MIYKKKDNKMQFKDLPNALRDIPKDLLDASESLMNEKMASNERKAQLLSEYGVVNVKELPKNKLTEFYERLSEGFDPQPADIAKTLIKRHGVGNVTRNKIMDYEDEMGRDSRKSLDYNEILAQVAKHKTTTEERGLNREPTEHNKARIVGAARPPSSKVQRPDTTPSGFQAESVEHLDEAPTRKHFQQVADLIKREKDPAERQRLANHHAGIFHSQNPRFDHKRWHQWIGTKNETSTQNEEVESIDEISKKKLGAYIKGASHDAAWKSAAVGRHADRANRVSDEMKQGKYDNFTQGKKDSETADKFFTKSWKRRMGIAKATDKLTREEANLDEEYKVGSKVIALLGPHKGAVHEIIHDHGNGKYNIKPHNMPAARIRYSQGAAQADKSQIKPVSEALDEISKKKLGAYIRKATDDRNATALAGLLQGAHQYYSRKFDKRTAGIKRATDKLTKEATDPMDDNGWYAAREMQGKAYADKKYGKPTRTRDMYPEPKEDPKYFDKKAKAIAGMKKEKQETFVPKGGQPLIEKGKKKIAEASNSEPNIQKLSLSEGIPFKKGDKVKVDTTDGGVGVVCFSYRMGKDIKHHVRLADGGWKYCKDTEMSRIEEEAASTRMIGPKSPFGMKHVVGEKTSPDGQVLSNEYVVSKNVSEDAGQYGTVDQTTNVDGDASPIKAPKREKGAPAKGKTMTGKRLTAVDLDPTVDGEVTPNSSGKPSGTAQIS